MPNQLTLEQVRAWKESNAGQQAGYRYFQCTPQEAQALQHGAPFQGGFVLAMEWMFNGWLVTVVDQRP